VLARGRGLALVVASVGLAIAIPEALRLAQGAADRWVQTFLRDPVPLIAAAGFSVTATPMQGLVAALAIASMLALGLVMARTPAGRAWRAAAEDPGAAALFGVDLNRVAFLTFVASGALSGLAGFMLVANYGGIGFSAGLLLGLKALLAAVVGGVGSLAGAALAGALIGIVETFWSGYFEIAYKDVAVLALLTMLLVLRPGGLLGFAERGPRPV
jgi:branched-chain amino acid transport system permease protein